MKFGVHITYVYVYFCYMHSELMNCDCHSGLRKEHGRFKESSERSNRTHQTKSIVQPESILSRDIVPDLEGKQRRYIIRREAEAKLNRTSRDPLELVSSYVFAGPRINLSCFSFPHQTFLLGNA